MQPDANGWIKGLENAPKEERLELFIPFTERDGERNYDHQFGEWNGERWDGERRYMVDHPLSDAEPSHWRLPTVPADYENELEAA